MNRNYDNDIDINDLIYIQTKRQRVSCLNVSHVCFLLPCCLERRPPPTQYHFSRERQHESVFVTSHCICTCMARMPHCYYTLGALFHEYANCQSASETQGVGIWSNSSSSPAPRVVKAETIFSISEFSSCSLSVLNRREERIAMINAEITFPANLNFADKPPFHISKAHVCM